MSHNLKTLRADATVKDAAAVLADGSIHSVVVVEGTSLIGIVTSTDLIRFLLEQFR